MDPTYPVFPVFAVLGAICLLVPLPWHLQAWNSGTCLFMIWTAIGCIIHFINSIVWHGNWQPIWCDISTRLTVGISVAIPASSLCINRRLYMISACRTLTSYTQRRRAVLIDLLIGLGLPALQMVFQFIVQGHRFDIFEDIGCTPTTVNTPPAYPLSFLWPNIISLVSGIYCILTLRNFMIRRAQFSQLVTSLTMNRYFRLMCLALAEIFITIYWYTIDVYPASIWRSSETFTLILELNRWSLVLSALMFFAFFGFAEESRKNYRRVYTKIQGRFKASCPGISNKCSSTFKEDLPMKSAMDTLPGFITTTSTTLPPQTCDFCCSVGSVTSNSNTNISSATIYGLPEGPPPLKWLMTIATDSRMSRYTI